MYNTNIHGTVPDEVCELRSKCLNPLWEGDLAFFADCSPENGTAFIECDLDCCTHCCTHVTQFCKQQGHRVCAREGSLGTTTGVLKFVKYVIVIESVQSVKSGVISEEC